MKTAKMKKHSKSSRVPEFPVAVETTGHAPLNETTLPTESVSFEHLTTKAACMTELGKYSDQFRALVDQTERTRRLGMDLVRFTEKQFGPLSHFGQASTPSERIDGRKVHNPEKNLKISVRRIFGWAKDQGVTADEARERALTKIGERARTVFEMAKIPEGVVEKIEKLHREYDLIGTEKEVKED